MTLKDLFSWFNLANIVLRLIAGAARGPRGKYFSRLRRLYEEIDDKWNSQQN